MSLLESVNDSRVLERSAIFYFVQVQKLFNEKKGEEGFAPFLLGNKGYPLLSWLMMPHGEGDHNLFEMLYNEKHK